MRSDETSEVERPMSQTIAIMIDRVATTQFIALSHSRTNRIPHSLFITAVGQSAKRSESKVK
jgi:hypothetical protein